jgi:dTDP-4-amino-4,6-dideoxygalactose transaminase
MAVSFYDLARQNNPFKDEYQAALTDILSGSQYILGAPLEKFEQDIKSYLGLQHAIGVNSGSDALLMTLHGLGVIESGDEIICPAFCYPEAANVIPRVGANITFVDVNADYTLDVEAVRASITDRTRVVICPHLFGRVADMVSLQQISSEYGVHLIEDCTHAAGARFDNQFVGTFGIAGIYSFYPTRNLGGLGDGGMVVTNNIDLADRLRQYRNLGRDRDGRALEIGYNSRLDALQAAFLDVKLGSLDEDNADRIANAAYYDSNLNADTFVIPSEAAEEQHVYSHYTIRHSNRDQVLNFLRERMVETKVYYSVPLHLEPCFAYQGYQEGHFPVAEQLTREVLSLPISPGLTRKELEEVTHALNLYAQTYSAPAPS